MIKLDKSLYHGTRGKWEVSWDYIRHFPRVRVAGKCLIDIDNCSGKEAEANAHLIVASPKMIEFIQQLANNGNQEAKDFIQTLDLS